MNQNVSHFIDYNNTKIPAVNIINSYWSSVVLVHHPLFGKKKRKEVVMAMRLFKSDDFQF